MPGAVTLPSRLPALDALLGSAIEAITWELVTRLVELHADEGQYLDFKQTLYGKNDRGQKDLLGDVTAMANAGGGLLVLGVNDDEGRAGEATPVELSDDELTRMRSLIAQNVAPVIVDVQVGAVRETLTDTQGFVVLAVPDSSAAPHAIRWSPRPTWAWPVRDGTTTRWVQEPEIADRYRNRFSAARDQEARLNEIWADGISQLAADAQVWLVLAAVPDRRGSLIAQRRLLPTSVQPWLREMNDKLPLRIYTEGSIGVGRRRLLLSDRIQVNEKATQSHAELHSDGSVFIANHVGALQQVSNSQLSGHPDDVAFYVEQEYLEAYTILAVALAEAWARRQQGGGDMAVRVTLWIPEPPFNFGSYNYTNVPLKLTNRVRGTYSTARRTLGKVARTETALPIATEQDRETTLASSFLIATDIASEFGVTQMTVMQDESTVINSRENGSIMKWLEGGTSP